MRSACQKPSAAPTRRAATRCALLTATAVPAASALLAACTWRGSQPSAATSRPHRLVLLGLGLLVQTTPHGGEAPSLQLTAEWQRAVDKANRVGADATPRSTLEAHEAPHASLNFMNSLVEALTQDPAPDLLALASSGTLAGLAQRKLLQPLDPVLRLERHRPEFSFLPSMLDALRLGGTLYALPLEVAPLVLWCQPALLAAAGLSPPDDTSTWDTLARAAQALTSDADHDGQPEQWGLLDPAYDVLIWQAGGNILAPDRRHALLTAPPALLALQFSADLYRTYRVVPPPVTDSLTRFGTGGITVSQLTGAVLPVAMAYEPAPSHPFFSNGAVGWAQLPRGRQNGPRAWRYGR